MMTRRWILLIVAAGCGLPCASATAAPAWRASDPSPLCAAQDPGWEQDILEVLRDIYEALLGNLLDSPGSTANAAMQEVASTFQQNGFRTDLTNARINALLADLDQAESLLGGDVPPEVDTGIAADFLELIPTMRNALQPPG